MKRLSLLIMLTCGALVAAACGDDDAPGGADASIDIPDAYTGPDANTMCPDPLPAETMCDFFLSCGCNTPAEKCSAEGTGVGCVTAGQKAEGELCADDTECAAGTICALYGGMNRCLRFCDPAHPCPTDEACYIAVTGSGGADIGAVCGQVCDLRTQDCQFEGQGCYPSQALLGQPEHGICVDDGAGTQGSTCDVANDCAEGFTCLDSDDKCHKFCDRNGGTPSCDAGQTCIAIKNHADTGVCQ
jgi:hypothetical protein